MGAKKEDRSSGVLTEQHNAWNILYRAAGAVLLLLMPANLYIAMMVSDLKLELDTHFRLDNPFGEYAWALSYVGCAAYWWFKPKETPLLIKLYVILSQIPIIALLVIWMHR